MLAERVVPWSTSDDHQIADTLRDLALPGGDAVALESIEQRAQRAIGIAALGGLAHQRGRLDAARAEIFVDGCARFENGGTYQMTDLASNQAAALHAQQGQSDKGADEKSSYSSCYYSAQIQRGPAFRELRRLRRRCCADDEHRCFASNLLPHSRRREHHRGKCGNFKRAGIRWKNEVLPTPRHGRVVVPAIDIQWLIDDLNASLRWMLERRRRRTAKIRSAAERGVYGDRPAVSLHRGAP